MAVPARVNTALVGNWPFAKSDLARTPDGNLECTRPRLP
jgi:hypothetical protein